MIKVICVDHLIVIVNILRPARAPAKLVVNQGPKTAKRSLVL